MSEHTPDLNAQVATKVMGWELHHVPEHPDPAIRWQWNHPEHPEWRRGLPCLHPLPPMPGWSWRRCGGGGGITTPSKTGRIPRQQKIWALQGLVSDVTPKANEQKS
jgi:hypothetical protein